MLLKHRNNFTFMQLDAEQKLEQARIFKEKGTKHFKVQSFTRITVILVLIISFIAGSKI